MNKQKQSKTSKPMRESHTFSTTDEKINERMSEVDNKSAFLESLVRRQIRLDEILDGVDDKGEFMERLIESQTQPAQDDLTQEQRECLEWTREMILEQGRVSLDTLKNRLAQQTSKSGQLVIPDIIRPLDSKGYIEVTPSMDRVWVSLGEKSV